MSTKKGRSRALFSLAPGGLGEAVRHRLVDRVLRPPVVSASAVVVIDDLGRRAEALADGEPRLGAEALPVVGAGEDELDGRLDVGLADGDVDDDAESGDLGEGGHCFVLLLFIGWSLLSPWRGGSRLLLLGPLEPGRLGLLADLADQDGAVLALALEALAARAVDVGAFPPCPIGLHVELASDGLRQQLLERGSFDFALGRRDGHRRRLRHPLVTEHGVKLERDAVGRVRHAEALREFRQDVDRDDNGVGPRLPSRHREPAARVGDAATEEVGAVQLGVQSEDGGDADLGHSVASFVCVVHCLGTI